MPLRRHALLVSCTQPTVMPPLLCQSLVLGLSTPSTTEALERHESIIKLRLQKADIDNNHRIRLFCRDEVGPCAPSTAGPFSAHTCCCCSHTPG